MIRMMRILFVVAELLVLSGTIKAGDPPLQFSVQPGFEVRQAPTPTPKPAISAPETTTDGLDELNAKRATRGLPPYQRDAGLTRAARDAAAFRAAHLMFGHVSDTNLGDFRFLPAGVKADSAGCAAYEPQLGWLSCDMWEAQKYAGAAWAMGRDGKRYMHLYISNMPSAYSDPVTARAPQCDLCSDCGCVECDCSFTSDPAKATVHLKMADAGGTGVCVYAFGGVSLILTNRHVAERIDKTTGELTVEKDGQTRKAWFMGWSDDDDLAMLWCKGELPAAKIASEYPKAGETLTLYGYGAQHDGTPAGTLNKKTGTAIGYESEPGNGYGAMPRYQTDFICLPGDSGGGVFNSKNEMVCCNHGNNAVVANGVVVQKATISYSVGLTNVRSFTRIKAGPRFPRLARLLGRNPVAVPVPVPVPTAPATPVPVAPAPKPAPKSDPTPLPTPFPISTTPNPFAVPQCQMQRQAVYDSRGRFMGYRQIQVCPQSVPTTPPIK